MSLLNQQEKEVFLKLARSQDADIIKEYITKVIREITDVDNLTTDALQNARQTKQILTTNLLDVLTDNPVEPQEEDSWE